VGSFAIVALMTGVSVRNIYQTIDNEYVQSEIHFRDDISGRGGQFDLFNYTLAVPKMQVTNAQLVQAITFTSGLIYLLLGLLHVEFLASYLSDQLVNGFCTGAAVHVIANQLGKMLEINVAKFTGPGYLLKATLI
jgi:MFS superfamily sulfate permease-like transporter